MTLKDEKIKVLGMIEELNPESPMLTDDPDIAAKINESFNTVMYELARMKKIPKFVELEVQKGDMVDFAAFEKKCGYEVYQVNILRGVKYESKANGTVFKMLESGTLEADLFVYPELITAKTKDSAYEFELSPDVLQIMPFGVAAVLLMSDVSSDYGRVYAQKYESMLQRLDPRNQMQAISFKGGVKV
jgi:hypothetical protein